MPNDDDEIDWHRQRIVENQSLLKELEAGNEDGGEVFPETRAEIERLETQIEQSQLIVAAHEKQITP
jgi:predicted  nucleic acid-binding Zn-ribbon protein